MNFVLLYIFIYTLFKSLKFIIPGNPRSLSFFSDIISSNEYRGRFTFLDLLPVSPKWISDNLSLLLIVKLCAKRSSYSSLSLITAIGLSIVKLLSKSSFNDVWMAGLHINPLYRVSEHRKDASNQLYLKKKHFLLEKLLEIWYNFTYKHLMCKSPKIKNNIATGAIK